jgi:hypothetical protein
MTPAPQPYVEGVRWLTSRPLSTLKKGGNRCSAVSFYEAAPWRASLFSPTERSPNPAQQAEAHPVE